MTDFDARRLVGAWQLVRWYITYEDSTVTEPLGPDATGLLVLPGVVDVHTHISRRGASAESVQPSIPVPEQVFIVHVGAVVYNFSIA